MLKEINMKIQEAQRAPNKMDAKRPTPRHIIFKMPKIKEKILKAAREKQLVTYRGVPIDCQLISQKKLCRLQGMARNIQSHEKQGPISKIALPSKAII